MKLSRDLVVLDLETTGVWIDKDKIIEIALIKCKTDGTKLTYEKRVNPEIPIPAVATEITGISDADVENCPKFREIAKEVYEFVENCELAGFNSDRFDLPLLERELREAGYKFEWRLCSRYDAQRVYHANEKRDLTAAYKFYCNKELVNAHSALADTEATLEILKSQVEKYGNGSDAIETLREFDYKETNEYYDSERKFRWWNKKLYMMFGKYARKLTLQEVAKKDPGYLDWICSTNFSDEIKGLAKDALNGNFPIYALKNDE